MLFCKNGVRLSYNDLHECSGGSAKKLTDILTQAERPSEAWKAKFTFNQDHSSKSFWRVWETFFQKVSQEKTLLNYNLHFL